MSQRTMIVCDNPDCGSMGDPEFIPGQDGPKRRGQRVMAPYGWHQGDGWLQGCGPSYTYMACSDACVGPAVVAVVEAERDKERYR